MRYTHDPELRMLKLALLALKRDNNLRPCKKALFADGLKLDKTLNLPIPKKLAKKLNRNHDQSQRQSKQNRPAA